MFFIFKKSFLLKKSHFQPKNENLIKAVFPKSIYFINAVNSSVRVSKDTKNDFYDSKQTEIAVDYFNSKYILFKAETNTSMIHNIDIKKTTQHKQ